MNNIITGNYVKNIWYNLICVIIISATLIISTVYISNILSQTKLYRLISPYLNEKSILMFVKNDFDDSELIKVDDSIMTKELVCLSEQIPNLRKFAVYDEEVMRTLKPRLASGRHINDFSEGEIEVLASDSGFKVGDIVAVTIFDSETEEPIQINVRVVGIIADGQKLFMFNGKINPNEMRYGDMYLTYSYDQLKHSVLITTEEQLTKLDNPVVYRNYSCIYKFEEEITEEENYINLMKITEYEMSQGDTPTSSLFPSSKVLTERMEEDVENIILKYVPLTIGIVVLMIVCLTGIVSVKTVKNMRYFSIMHICGMNHRKITKMSGTEMLFNCVLATLLAISLIVIQNRSSILGIINCELGLIQIIIMFVINFLIVVITMLVTISTLKENSTMEILRDTAY